MDASGMRSPTQSVLLVILSVSIAAAGCLKWPTQAQDGENTSVVPSEPEWMPGDWWRYQASNGITYVYTYEAKETKEGHEAYRVRINLSQPDEHGTQQYTYWYAVGNMGSVAWDQAPVYVKHDCPAGAWFPLDQRVEDDCGMTWYYHGSFLERYNEKNAKVPIGWEWLSLPAGQFRTYRFHLQDRNTNETVSTHWYSGEVENLVQSIGNDGVTYRLLDWGE